MNRLITVFLFIISPMLVAADALKSKGMSTEDHTDFCAAQGIASHFFQTQKLINEVLSQHVSMELVVLDRRDDVPIKEWLDKNVPKISKGLLVKEQNGMLGCLITKWGKWHFAHDRCAKGCSDPDKEIEELVFCAIYNTIWPAFIDVMLGKAVELEKKYARIDVILRSGHAGDMYNMQIFKVLRDVLCTLYETIKDQEPRLKLKICGYTLDHNPMYVVESFDHKELRNPFGNARYRDQQNISKRAKRRVLRLSEHRLSNKEKEWNHAKKCYIEQAD